MLKQIVIVAVLFSATSIADVQSGQYSRQLTGAEQICLNRCEAKGWPRACFEDCMRRGR